MWQIEMKLKNTGTETATLISCFINDEEVDDYDETGPVLASWATNVNITTTTTITSGQSKVVYFWIDPARATSTLSSGTTINIKIHSAGGMDYLKLVELV
jgi:hypothetical protein